MPAASNSVAMGGFRTTVVVALAASACVAPMAVAAPHAAFEAARPQPHTARADLIREAVGAQRPQTAAALRARYLTMARARLALSGDLDGESGTAAPAGHVAIAAPVRDGAGRYDVAVLTMPTGEEQSVLSVRDARTGRVRWHRTVTDAWGFDVARLGRSRRPSLVVYATSFVTAGDPAGLTDNGTQSNDILVFDIATGAPVWSSQPLLGMFTVSPESFSEANALYPAGILHDRGGDRILAINVSQSFSFYGQFSTAQPLIYDGVTGAMTRAGQPVSGDDAAEAMPAGDLNSDGLVDWYSFVGGDIGSIQATSGADGSQLWARQLASGGELDTWPIPDLNGDHRPDVVVGETNLNDTVTAYDGRTGSTLFTQPADAIVGIAGTAHRPTVLLATFPDEPGVRISAIDGRGHTAWTRTDATSLSDNGGSSQWEFGPAGDVDGDRIMDVFVDVSYTTPTTAKIYTDVISGRTGHLYRGRPLGEPLGFALHGTGADFIVTMAKETRWQVTAYDGTTRQRLWTLSRPVSSRAFLMTPFTLIPQRQPTLLAALWDGNATQVFAVNGSTGRVLWVGRI